MENNNEKRTYKLRKDAYHIQLQKFRGIFWELFYGLIYSEKNAVLITIELVLYLFSIELVVYLYKFVSAIISEYYIISDLRHNLLLMLERLKYRWYICCCLAASAWIERCPSIHYSKQFKIHVRLCSPLSYKEWEGVLWAEGIRKANEVADWISDWKAEGYLQGLLRQGSL